ncbi:hypothetical protein HB816_12975 [Listeria booriae]|uniref:hypothetical protein n=1 Tax=Listeria booriae TaxID=1552123 RepID=UPI0016270589|nr:hypothetical protein [Listeria booriae]MBC1231369.1 hypothetical protein [Listeria booriae]
MFYTKLNNIYKENFEMQNFFPFNEFYPILRSFLSSEIKLDAMYISPYRFSIQYSVPIQDSIRLFLALSEFDTGIFKMKFKYECVECREINIMSSERYSSVVCQECDYEHENLNSKDDITIMFSISHDLFIYFKEAQESIKKMTPSSGKNLMEEGIRIEDAINCLEPPEPITKEVADRIRVAGYRDVFLEGTS